jgi:hypothetical protein
MCLPRHGGARRESRGRRLDPRWNASGANLHLQQRRARASRQGRIQVSGTSEPGSQAHEKQVAPRLVGASFDTRSGAALRLRQCEGTGCFRWLVLSCWSGSVVGPAPRLFLHRRRTPVGRSPMLRSSRCRAPRSQGPRARPAVAPVSALRERSVPGSMAQPAPGRRGSTSAQP